VLVTGSSGHVGGAFARHLLERGYDVVGVARRIAELPSGITQMSADIASPEFIERIHSVGPCDAIVHAAAALSKEPYDLSISATNGIGMQQTLHVAHLWGVRSFVYISGVAVIGPPVQFPLTKDHPPAPATAYHASKLYGEHLASIARNDGLPTVTLRLTSPVGPGTPPGRILTTFVARAKSGQPLPIHGKGTRRQNYVDVRDAAVAAEMCIAQRVTGLFNIGGAGTFSNLELAQRCIDVLGSRSTIEFTGQPDSEDDTVWEVSSKPAQSVFGYAPCYAIEDSIQAMA
jgi:nucleoside-diphosphate-sugar epimerase